MATRKKNTGPIDLGDEVRDRVTGFKGIAYGRVTYMTGCKRIIVLPTVGKDGKMPDSHWIDEPQLEIIAKAKCVVEDLTPAESGGPPLHPTSGSGTGKDK